MKYLIFQLLGIMIITSTAIAQPIKNCGTKKTDTAFLLSMAMLERQHPERITATSRMIKVYIHVLYNTDGTNESITPGELQDEFQDLLQDYASNNLCFYLAGVDTIRSTALNANFNADTDPDSEFSVHNVPGCLNIYYVSKINGTNNACSPPCGYGGIALGGIPGTFCLVDDGNIGEHTISHEVGHCLGLSHTFATINGRECINGSNSWSSGDVIIDTPADPYSFNGSSCFSKAGCLYTGSCNDPCGDDDYDPPYTNIMSYWDCSNQVFTNGQFARINATIDNNSAINALAAPSTYTLNTANVSSGYFTRAAINNFTTSGTINITSSAKASLGGISVTISPGFTSSPGSTGSTSIKAHTCN